MFENGAVDPRLNALFEAALDAVIGMDEEGRVIAWNRQAEATFGWTAAEATGLPLVELIVPERHRQAHVNGLRRYLETGNSTLLNTRIEVEAIDRDGRVLPVELAIVAVSGHDGTVFYAFLRNIAARRAMEASLTRRAAESKILFEAAMLVSGEGGFDEMFRTFLRLICETVGWQFGHAYLVDEQAGLIVPSAIWHPSDAPLRDEMRSFRFQRGAGRPGRIWTTGEPEFIPDIEQASDFPRREIAVRHGIRSTFGFPVFVDGRVHAVLEFFSREARSLDEEEIRLVRTLGLQLGAVVERRRAAEQERLLLRELSHRTNNLIATTSAIFRQSARHAPSIEVLSRSFTTRLDLLAGATNLLSDRGWRSAPLRSLIDQAIAVVGASGRVHLSGPEMDVSAQNVVLLGLIFHELASNAAAHGALGTEAGEVSIEWEIENAAGRGGVLSLHWTERGGPTVAPAGRKGFGTMLFESLAAHRPGSTINLRFDPSGMRGTLKLSLDPTGDARPGATQADHRPAIDNVMAGEFSGFASASDVPIHVAAALDDVPVLIWLSGRDKGGVHFNRAWLDFTGRTRQEELGNGWVDRVHPEDLSALAECEAAFAAREPFQIEFRLRRADGAWRWMLDEATPRFGPDGAFLGFIGCCVDITERREVEAALRSSEERLQLAQQAAAIGTYDWDVETGRIDWSPGMFRLHDIDPATPRDALYSAWLARLHPDDRDRVDGETRRFVGEANDLSIEFRSVHADGGIRWIQGRGRVIRDEAGRPLRMVGANFDVTDQRLAEEALREGEQRLRDIAENFPGIIFRRITWPDGRVEYPYFSGADQQIFHLPRQRLDAIRTMEDVVRLVHVEDLDDMMAKFERAAADLTPLEVEGRIVADDGEIRWVRSISRPRRRADGALIWDGVLLDVSEQHRREGARERAATMLRMGTEVAGIGTWEYDAARGEVTGSTVTNAIFRLPEDGCPRSVEEYIMAVHPEDAHQVRRGLVKGAAERRSTAREYRVIAGDGTVRWILSRGAYARLADGSERLIGALQDVTERRRREEEREAALREHRILLREINHRMKNNIQMVSSVLKLQAARAPEQAVREQLAKAIGRVQTIGDLHAQFGPDADAGRIDLGEYLQQMCARLRDSVLGERPVELRCETVPCVVDLLEAVPLGLVVNELVTNAIKYAFPNDREGEISIILDGGEGDGLVLTVRDTGVGMPDNSEAGSGLGRQLVQGLLDQIGSTMEVTGSPGVTYVISLPAQAEPTPRPLPGAC